MNGFVHSIQSFSTLDGPGIRSVVFLYGCPLRCAYCHNPDTWSMADKTAVSAQELIGKIVRFMPFIKSGGVTFSGGEPCIQADFIFECAQMLHDRRLNVAIDTSGAVFNDSVARLLSAIDMALLDIKFTNENDYRKYTGGSLDDTLNFLNRLEQRNIPVWIRHVVIPGINDNESNIRKLKELTSHYSVVKKIELLPFRKLCISKYEQMKIEFPLADTPELSNEKLFELERILND